MAPPIWITQEGLIGTINEGQSFSTILQWSNGPATAAIISGSLPSNFVFTPSLHNAEIIGTANLIPKDQEFYFTIRIQNNDGFADRYFKLIIDSAMPIWSQSSNIGTYSDQSDFSFQFNVTDPGGTVKFQKISGTIPPELTFNSSGLLQGFIKEIIPNTQTFSFGVRAKFGDGTVIDRNFNLTVTKSLGNKPPVWITSAGYIGNVNQNESSNLFVEAFDPDGQPNPLVYSLTTPFPNGVGQSLEGLTFNSDGTITGILVNDISATGQFTVAVTDGVAFSYRTFQLSVNSQPNPDITWITPSGSIGALKVGEESYLRVFAEAESYVVSYNLIPHSNPPLGAVMGLPLGLTLDVPSGEIHGRVQTQTPITTPALPAQYAFGVRAISATVDVEDRDFLITINPGLAPKSLEVRLKLNGEEKIDWNELISDSFGISPKVLYRQFDEISQKKANPSILLVSNLLNRSHADIFNVLENVGRVRLVVQDLKLARARFPNGKVRYEVIYRALDVEGEEAEQEFEHPQQSPLAPSPIRPASITNLRRNLLLLGIDPGLNGGEILPEWMTSPQIVGDNSTIIGYIPAIEVCRVMPGQGETVLTRLMAEEVIGQRLLGRELDFNSLGIEPYADKNDNPNIYDL